MIVEALMTVLLGVVRWFVSLIPDFGLSLNLSLAEAFTTLGGIASSLNGWVPVLVLGIALAAMFIVEAAMTLWGFVVWLYHQFWGSD